VDITARSLGTFELSLIQRRLLSPSNGLTVLLAPEINTGVTPPRNAKKRKGRPQKGPPSSSSFPHMSRSLEVRSTENSDILKLTERVVKKSGHR
jgi:hypothetical protein